MKTTRYGPYTSNTGHLFYIDIDQNGDRKIIWVHRELMETHLGRSLNDNEIVHHKDGNKVNNPLLNLEVLSREDHARIHALEDPAETTWFVCPECGKDFQRLNRRLRDNQIKQKKKGPFCGKSCAGRYGQKIQMAL